MMKKNPPLKHVTAVILAASGLMAHAADGGLLDRLIGSEKATVLTAEELEAALSIEDFRGRKVLDQNGRLLGKITDLTLSDRQGGFDKAVLEVGNILDWNKALIAIPYDQLEHPEGTSSLVWKVARKDFQALVAQAKERQERLADPKSKSTQPEVSRKAKEDGSKESAKRPAGSESTTTVESSTPDASN